MGLFSQKEFLLLGQFKGKELINVDYFIWINLANKEDLFAFVDTILLTFAGNEQLLFSINDSDTGIHLLDSFDYESEKIKIKTSTQGQTDLYKKNMNDSELWVGTIGKKLVDLETDEFDEGHSNEMLRMEFEDQKREMIFHFEDGIVVEIFEDEEET
jgi:hypothetical protein